MPIYEYQCRSCERRVEVLQRLDDPPLDACPDCGGEMKKLLSAPAFQFKGSGWYVTDYARKGGAQGEKAEEPKAAKAEGAKDAASGSGKDSASNGAAAKASGGGGKATSEG